MNSEFMNIFERISLIKKEININNMFEKGANNIFKKKDKLMKQIKIFLK